MGLGAYLLAMELTGDSLGSFLAGVVYSFASPHVFPAAWGHLPTYTAQWIPFFLLFWIRLVNSPGWKNLLVAILFFILAACAEPYQAVFCSLLGGLYLIIHGIRIRKRGLSHLFILAKWVMLFCLLCALFLIPLFWPAIWMARHYPPLQWSRDSYLKVSVPLLGWLLPWKRHILHSVLRVDYSSPLGEGAVSYHGVFSIISFVVILITSAKVRERTFFLVGLAICIFLSWASCIQWKEYALYQLVPILKHMRSTCRFNIPGSLMLALISAAGFIVLRNAVTRGLGKRALARYAKTWELGWFIVVLVFVSLDLCIAPLSVVSIPELPRFFKEFPAPDKDECILEIPCFGFGDCAYAVSMYWQSYHRWTTNAVYMAYNRFYPRQCSVWMSSPFFVMRFSPSNIPVAREYENWDCKPFLKQNRVRYVVFHIELSPFLNIGWDGKILRRALEQGRAWMRSVPIYRDQWIEVYDTNLIGSCPHRREA
jgi:hypothetical protein